MKNVDDAIEENSINLVKQTVYRFKYQAYRIKP